MRFCSCDRKNKFGLEIVMHLPNSSSFRINDAFNLVLTMVIFSFGFRAFGSVHQIYKMVKIKKKLPDLCNYYLNAHIYQLFHYKSHNHLEPVCVCSYRLTVRNNPHRQVEGIWLRWLLVEFVCISMLFLAAFRVSFSLCLLIYAFSLFSIFYYFWLIFYPCAFSHVSSWYDRVGRPCWFVYCAFDSSDISHSNASNCHDTSAYELGLSTNNTVVRSFQIGNFQLPFAANFMLSKLRLVRIWAYYCCMREFKKVASCVWKCRWFATAIHSVQLILMKKVMQRDKG